MLQTDTDWEWKAAGEIAWLMRTQANLANVPNVVLT